LPIEGSESVEEIYAFFKSGDCIFIDARMPEDYVKGHIPHAISLPLELFNEVWPKVAPTISREALIITYCDGQECNSSRELAEKLRALGFTSVRAFVGGWNAWRNAGYPIEKGS
jgi:rhodanese-related sulfurtransferase